jgi:hypothetical protein
MLLVVFVRGKTGPVKRPLNLKINLKILKLNMLRLETAKQYEEAVKMLKFIKEFAIWFAILSMFFCVLAIGSQDAIKKHVTHDEVTRFVKWVFKDMNQMYFRKAVKHIPVVVEESQKLDIDPLLTAVVITYESGWRDNVTSTSKYKEKGLMQVHGVAARSFNIKTSKGQIQAGTNWLKKCYNTCGSWRKALNCYQTSGKCNAKIRGAKLRWQAYQHAIKRYRG